ncbi:hypothetical protein Aph01nite_34390 [Acrocarpospora phusangensis]|uniref:SWIM-type domain-containing protein n=1 Tax=Acrocarpospora phusangensis TaxID=1070424 RepID=A0A919UKL0_9ACTN|nr:DUF6011 domain-containing protein [Acrocarpospora phusangensis]GIH25129.1 hypothetical protein Aph01nite_34390 [Acrocarpospora phusangensis]
MPDLRASTASCLRCGRNLTSPESIQRGYGRQCRTLMSLATTKPTPEGFSATQMDKAWEAIEQGAIVRTSRFEMFTAVSTDGTTHYLIRPGSCTCPAGQRGHLCYHRLAVHIITATVGRKVVAS